MNIVILTEADETVATGHLMESIELAQALTDSGCQVKLLVNGNCPAELLGRITCSYSLYPRDTDSGIARIRQCLSAKTPDILVTDLRSVDDEMIRKIRKSYQGKIICIDELGHRKLSCDVIINPMAGSDYWKYQTEARTYFGAQYLILPGKIASYHKMEKSIPDKIRRIAVSMGGADSKGTTLKLLRWLPDILADASYDIIMGGGFAYQQQAEELAEKFPQRDRVRMFRNTDHIYDFFYKADLAFCAGGNTLHELSCIGTPSIVIPTMPHEWDNGQVFEQAGFGKCLGLCEDVGKEELAQAVGRMQKAAVRKAMCEAGKRFSDGNGCRRVVRIIQEQMEKEE